MPSSATPTPSLRKLLRSAEFPSIVDNASSDKQLKALQHQTLRIQQGIWHQKHRAIIVFEGFDAAGKGGVIRRVVEELDPRGYQVHAIGPPSQEEQRRHYLYRFWTKLPLAGVITIFDRSWYGRVLVERVDGLTAPKRWRNAYEEIRAFEKMLSDDGIEIIKIFLAIDKNEQLRRFEERLSNPYKRWKLTLDDVRARSQWDKYVKAVDAMFEKTHTKRHPWHLIAANDKLYARLESLKVVTEGLKTHARWIESKTQKARQQTLKHALRSLGIRKKFFK